MTNAYGYTTTQFDWTQQMGNLAEAVKLLADAAYRDGFWQLEGAQTEAAAILAAMARLRGSWSPTPAPSERVRA